MNRRDFVGGLVATGAIVKTNVIQGLLEEPKPPFQSAQELYESVLGRPMYYNRQGQPIKDVFEWARLMDDRSYKVLAATHLPNDYWVSTVWLGLDHSFGFHGPPLIFETMAFEEKLSYHEPSEFFSRGFHYHKEHPDGAQERYATEAEALEGHRRMCEQICPGSLTLGSGGENVE